MFQITKRFNLFYPTSVYFFNKTKKLSYKKVLNFFKKTNVFFLLKNNFFFFLLNNSKLFQVFFYFILRIKIEIVKIKTQILNAYKRSIGEGFLYLRGLFLIFFVDACITDDEPL